MIRLCVMGDVVGVKGFDIASLAVPFVVEKIRALLYHYANSSGPPIPSPGLVSIKWKSSFHMI